jgi:hypothetical protein
MIARILIISPGANGANHLKYARLDGQGCNEQVMLAT